MLSRVENITTKVLEKIPPGPLLVAAGILGAATLAGCTTGDEKPDSGETVEVTDAGTYLHPSALDAVGNPLVCYKSEGRGTAGIPEGQYAWLSLSCDFKGVLTHPETGSGSREEMETLDDAVTIAHPSIIDAQGDPMECVQISGSDTARFFREGHLAWQGIACDFSGNATL